MPSRSATGPASIAPSTQVPWLEPASSIRPVRGGDPRVRARDAGIVELQRRAGRAADDHVLDERHALAAGQHQLERRLAVPERRAAAPAEGSPPRHLAAAVRAQHGPGLPRGQRLEDGVVAAELQRSLGLRVVDRQPDQLARRRAEAVVGAHDDELLAVGPPDHLARAHAERLGLREREVVGLREQQLGQAVGAEVDDRHRLPSGEIAASSTPWSGFDVSVTILPSL